MIFGSTYFILVLEGSLAQLELKVAFGLSFKNKQFYFLILGLPSLFLQLIYFFHFYSKKLSKNIIF